MQSYAWPMIIRGSSAIFVSGPKTGKTLGYLVPIMNTALTSYFEDTNERKPIQPSFVIICSSADSVSRVARLANDLNPKKLIKINHLVYSKLTTSEEILLRKGTDLLIATPLSFMEAKEQGVSVSALIHRSNSLDLSFS